MEIVRDYEFLKHYVGGWQFGEQGVLKELARRCECKQGVEIGAGDGESLPVTLDFMYDLVLFEIDKDKQKKLAKKYLNATIYGRYTDEYSVTVDDNAVVVVDVDSEDLAIACSVLRKSQPAVICVEHYDRHGAYMTDKSQREPSEPVPSWLLGLRTIDNHTIQQPWQVVARTLDGFGYELVALTRVNGIYIHASYKEQVNGWTD